MTKTRVPAIPAPTEANLREVARALKVLADIREGVTGDPLDRFVTFRDLDDGGVASVSLSGGRVSGIRPFASIAGLGYDPTADLTTPPQPTGVTATGAFASVILSWDGLPAGYINHAYAEIFRADTDVIGDSVLIGTTLSTRFVDFIGNSATRYYWVRFVSQANVIGAYHGISGAVGTTSEDPELLLDALTGQITESQLFEDLGARINLIDDPATGLVAQVENVKGKYAVKIDNAGHVSGYGLASSPNDSTPTSEFGIRADKFWVAGASTASSTEPTTDLYKGRVWRDTSVTPNVTRYYTGSAWSTTPQSNVFAVLNAPGTINGVSVPAGVYIDTAFIGNATIKSAQIGSVAADTIQAGYTTSVDLESATFFGSDFYIGGTVVYEYDDPTDPQRKTGISSVVNPAIALKGGATPTAEFTVDSFKVKTSADVGAIPLLTVSGNTVRINFNQLGNTLGDLGFTGDSNANYVTNTNQLTDGAGLGATANWAQVAGRPETLAALDATAAADLDGKTITFYQASEPTGTVNDLWFDTDDGNKLYRHDGTSWVAVQDAGIAAAALLATAAQGTADSKITTFYTTTTPTATSVGDLWYSTSTKLLKRWDGSVWVDAASMGAPSGTLVGSTSAEDVESNAANGNAAYTAITDSSTGLATKLANNARNALTGSAGLVAGTLAWDSSGARTSGFGVAMTSAGIAAYKSDGNASFALNASDGGATFAGALSAATGTFSGNLTAQAVNAVNTINIADNAVTIPVYANYASVELPYSPSFPNWSGYTTIADINLSSFGSTPVIVLISISAWPNVVTTSTTQTWRDLIFIEGRQTNNELPQALFENHQTHHNEVTFVSVAYIADPSLGSLIVKGLFKAEGNMTARASASAPSKLYLPFIKVTLIGLKK